MTTEHTVMSFIFMIVIMIMLAIMGNAQLDQLRAQIDEINQLLNEITVTTESDVVGEPI